MKSILAWAVSRLPQAASPNRLTFETSKCEPASTVSSKALVCPGGSCSGGNGKGTGKRFSVLWR